MTSKRDKDVNYDEVAPTYERRFAYYGGERNGVGAALLALARDVRAERILEVGCGTGHWLRVLDPLGCRIYGLDLSLGMLQQARAAKETLALIRGRASSLPFSPSTFDVVFCVNALHHFDDPESYIRNARLLLRPGGALAVIGMNPHAGRDRWFVYDYFPGTYATDLDRYPSSGTIVDWMISAGFDFVRSEVTERLVDNRVGRNILDEPMLQKNATSQLTLLSDEDYAAGVERIRAAVTAAEATGDRLVFSVDVCLHMVIGQLQTSRRSARTV